jgi:guanylate kinase
MNVDKKIKSRKDYDEILLVPFPTVPGYRITSGDIRYRTLNPITDREVRFTDGELVLLGYDELGKAPDFRTPNKYIHNKLDFSQVNDYVLDNKENLKAVIFISEKGGQDISFYQSVSKNFRTINSRPLLLFSKVKTGGDDIGKSYVFASYMDFNINEYNPKDNIYTDERFFPPNYDGVMGVSFIDQSLSDRRIPFVNFLVSDAQPKLYLVVAPTGFGKSTLIDEMKYLCVKPMPKITTRPHRILAEVSDSSIEPISSIDFTQLEKAGFIVGGHAYKGYRYGLRKDRILGLPSIYRNQLADSCDIDSALNVKRQFPDLIRLVTLFPSLSFAGYGLEQRLKKLSKPSDGFESFTEQLEYLRKNEIAFVDTKKRLERVVEESRKFEKYLPYFDIVLTGYDMQSNVNALLLEMAK